MKLQHQEADDLEVCSFGLLQSWRLCVTWCEELVSWLHHPGQRQKVVEGGEARAFCPLLNEMQYNDFSLPGHFCCHWYASVDMRVVLNLLKSEEPEENRQMV